MESVDRLLADLKAQYEAAGQASSPLANAEAVRPNSVPEPVQEAVPSPQLSLDQLLTQLGEPQKRAIRDQLSQRQLKGLTSPIASGSSQAVPRTAPTTPPPQPSQEISQARTPSPQVIQTFSPEPKGDPSKLLDLVHTQYAQADQATAMQQQQELEKQRQQAEAQKREQQKALEKAAQDWLKQVHVGSEEGLWFEEFAYNYASRLEAAIEYLQALRG